MGKALHMKQIKNFFLSELSAIPFTIFAIAVLVLDHSMIEQMNIPITTYFGAFFICYVNIVYLIIQNIASGGHARLATKTICTNSEECRATYKLTFDIIISLIPLFVLVLLGLAGAFAYFSNADSNLLGTWISIAPTPFKIFAWTTSMTVATIDIVTSFRVHTLINLIKKSQLDAAVNSRI